MLFFTIADGPRSVRISLSDDRNHLLCTSESNPPAAYRWTDDVSGQRVTVYSGGHELDNCQTDQLRVIRCEATNTVSNHTDSTLFRFNDSLRQHITNACRGE